MTDNGKFEKGDIVRFKLCFGESGAWQYGKVLNVNKKGVNVLFLFGGCKHKTKYCAKSEFCFSPEKLTYLPPMVIDKDELTKFLRGDVFFFEENPDFIASNVILPGDAEITIDDLSALLKNLSERAKNSKPIENPTHLTYSFTGFKDTLCCCVYTWFSVFCRLLKKLYKRCNIGTPIYHASDIIDEIIDNLDSMSTGFISCDLSQLYDKLKEFLEDKDLPVAKRRYPEKIKKRLVARYNSYDTNRLYFEPTEYLELYSQFARELAEKGDRDGLYAIAYGCYGGNVVFPCDWNRSRECLEKLFSDKEDENAAYYATSLGYITYYGRCNDGVPDYEKAFYYFSYAALWDIYEAKYKLADMYFNGYYVPKSIATAYELISTAYLASVQETVFGLQHTNLADLALRIGDIFPYYFCWYNENFVLQRQLYYYLQADFASKLRLLYSESYGNLQVDKTISERLEKAKQTAPDLGKPFVDEVYELLENTINLCPIKLRIAKRKNEKFYRITISVKHPKEPLWKFIGRYDCKDYYKSKCRLFITNASLQISGFYDEIKLKVYAYEKKDFKVLDNLIGKDITVDKINKWNELFYQGELVLSFDELSIYIVPPKEKKSHRMAVVNFGENNDLVKLKDEDICPGDDIYSKSHGSFGKVIKIADVPDNMLFAPVEVFD